MKLATCCRWRYIRPSKWRCLVSPISASPIDVVSTLSSITFANNPATCKFYMQWQVATVTCNTRWYLKHVKCFYAQQRLTLRCCSDTLLNHAVTLLSIWRKKHVCRLYNFEVRFSQTHWHCLATSRSSAKGIALQLSNVSDLMPTLPRKFAVPSIWQDLVSVV